MIVCGLKQPKFVGFSQSDRRGLGWLPRIQKWSRHFQWSEDGALIVGHTACGRATVIALQSNNLIAVTVRQQWVIAGWHPPENI